MTQLLIGALAGVALTLVAQYAAHRVRLYRLKRRWLRAHDQWRHSGQPYVMWPPPQPANPPGSLILEPLEPLKPVKWEET